MRFDDAGLGKVMEFIESRDYFLVIGHEAPDGDCAGSQLAAVSFLQRLGKMALALSAGPFTKPDVKGFERRFALQPPWEKLKREKAGALLVDCSSLSRTGFGALPCTSIAIDHHSVIEADAVKGFIDAASPSTTMLVLRLIKAFGQTPTKEEAELLLYGFCTDTGFFRHLTEQSGPYMRLAGELLDAGASPAKIYDQMQGSFSLASRRYLGRLLDRVESFYGGKLLMSSETQSDREACGPDIERDSAMLYSLLLSVEGVEAAVAVKDDERGRTVGLRSKNNADVGCIAGKFGGGGHKKAAGFLTDMPLAEIKAALVKEFAFLAKRAAPLP